MCGLAGAATFKLGDGRTVTGDLVASGSDDASSLIKTGDGKYERVPWGQFSQEDLKSFLVKFKGTKKIVDAVEPFIEVSQEERAKKTEVKINPVVRLEQPPKGSLVSSLFKSGIGVFLVFLIYPANVFVGYEIAIFRAQSTPLVAGLAAIPVLGVLSNIVFLSLPTKVETRSEADIAYEEMRSQPTPTIAIPGQEEAAQQAAQAAQAEAAGPRIEVFARGQFTFNKRFFETKFAHFFGLTRREEDRAKVLTFKTAKGQFIVQRISRITPSEVYIQADRGGSASVEMSLQFPEIQEITIQHHA